MQLTIFDGAEKFHNTKPIRLITLFSGYDSQALSLKYLGVPFEHYRTCEWAIPSIQALKDLHFGEDSTNYSENLTKEELVRELVKLGISADYNVPLTEKQIARYPEQKVRTIYNNIKASHNLVSITNIHGADLGIVDTENHCYIMTYSFPCQDLSNAGLGKGMEKGSGTRSGLLWEVERLLTETKELPQILLMENVKQVIGQNNIKDFAKWIEFLDGLGYNSKWQVLNAKDFGVPQNRERCFMVSVLGSGWFSLPEPMRGGEKKLKDVLVDTVEERYYLKNATIDYFVKHTKESEEKGNGFRFAPTTGGGRKSHNHESRGTNGRQFHYSQLRLGHGYFKGELKELAPTAPTIDAHIACWHFLIIENEE